MEGTPKSGVKGVTWNARKERWAVSRFGRFLGQYADLEAAKTVAAEAEAAGSEGIDAVREKYGKRRRWLEDPER